MHTMKRVSGFLTIVLLFAAGAAIAAGHEASLETCNACHGDNGVSKWSDVPTIAGLSEFYHADQLYAYRDTDRPCDPSAFRQGDTSRDPASMCDATADLSDDQIDALGAHYAGKTFVAAKQKFDAALVEAGKAIHERDCGMCHSDGGSNADDDAGILAGQWMGYMEKTFAEYRAGERAQPVPMKKKLDALSDDEVKALLNYYASQQ